MKKFFLIGITCFSSLFAKADKLLIPMDYTQSEHLMGYGIAFMVLEYDIEVGWLLNYRGGSFLFDYYPKFEEVMLERNVKYERLSEGAATNIIAEVSSESVNMDYMKLDKAPRIAVYSPKTKQPWDDAVTLVLAYSQIPYTIFYDEEILDDSLSKYDWLHLHHEDFTGQYGKFWANYRTQDWYILDVESNEEMAMKRGFENVAAMKLAVAKKVKSFCENGGFMFAMCSATDSYDIACAADGLDVIDIMFDGDPATPGDEKKLDFSKTLAFENFNLVMNPSIYEFSDIDANFSRQVPKELDEFSLFNFSAKYDPVPTMLCQNHTNRVKGFMGQTTAFNKQFLKKEVLIMGELKAYNEARYIHGNLGKGMWTYYGGHDPEDYQHIVGEEPTNLALYPNSPGYRLILNNILFPAAKPKKQKT